MSCSVSRKMELKRTLWITEPSACCFRCDSLPYPGKLIVSILGYFAFMQLLEDGSNPPPCSNSWEITSTFLSQCVPIQFLSPLKLNLITLFPPCYLHPSVSIKPHNPA